MDLQPTIIQRQLTPAEQEKLRLDRLMQQAQIQNLLAQPKQFQQQQGLEERKLQQQMLEHQAAMELQKLGITTQADTALRGQEVQQRGQNIEQRGQDIGYQSAAEGHAVTARGQDLSLTASREGEAGAMAREQLRAQMALTHEFLALTATDPSINSTDKADVLRRSGAPAAAEMLTQKARDRVAAELPQHLTTLHLLKDKPDAYKAAFADIQKDKDMYAALQAHPDYQDLKPLAPGSAAPVAASSNAPGYFPGLGRGLLDLPMHTANLGVDIANNVVIPPANLLGSVLGTPPIQRQPKMTQDDYNNYLRKIGIGQ